MAKKTPKRASQRSAKQPPRRGPRGPRGPAAGSPDPVKRLAATLGMQRKSLLVHVRKPDAPELQDVDGWRQYLAAIGRQGSAPPDLRRVQAIARARLAVAQAVRVETSTKVAAGELVDRDAVREGIGRALAAHFATLEAVMCSELPPVLVGLDERQLRERLRRAVEGFKAKLRNALAGEAAGNPQN